MSLAIEVGWPGWVGWILFVLLTGASAAHVMGREQSRLQERYWLDTLLDLRWRIEADLALGFDLEDSGRAQSLLDGAMLESGEARQLSVFDADGRILFDTDRSAIGEPVTGDVRTRAVAEDAWRVLSLGTVTVGVPLRGPAGQVAGQMALTLSPPATDIGTRLLPLLLLGSMALPAIPFVAVVAPLMRLSHAVERSKEDAAKARLNDAERRLTQVDAALGIDPRTSLPR